MTELLRSTRGMKLSYDGFFYVKQQAKSGKIRWTCELKRERGCTGANLTDMANGNPNPTKDHNHGRDLDKIETSKRREEMKCLALSTVAGPSSIQAGVLMHANMEAKEACSQAMARARKKSFPANPNNLNQLVIQNEFYTPPPPPPPTLETSYFIQLRNS